VLPTAALCYLKCTHFSWLIGVLPAAADLFNQMFV